MNIFKSLGVTFILYSTLFAQESGFDVSNAAFEAYKQKEDAAFKSYKEKLEKEFAAYKKELTPYWEEPKLSSKKEWVHYSDDKRSRSEVDFEKQSVTVEVVAKDVETAKKKLLEQIEYVASKDTKEVVASDELQKRVQELSQKEQGKSAVVDAKPILAPVLFAKKPSQKELKEYAQNALKSAKKSSRPSKLKDNIVYKVEIPLPSDTQLKRSGVYKNEVFANAKRFEIPVPLIFAIMQTESDFNPFAKSHIPAFGLMQIVPHSAGKDSYKMLYGRAGMPTASYLYNAQKNIEMGSSYLHILYYRYLKSIKNPQSRLYCAIAAYNTGSGNIAWAFTRSYSMKKAAPIINKMSPEAVYTHLLRNLRYDEPKHYLKKVHKRMSAYNKAYRS